MTQFLPPNLLAFFAPREPIPFLPPTTKQSHEKKTRGYSGVGQYLHLFEDPKDTPPPTKIETREERLERKKREKSEKAAYIKEQGIALWDPHNNPKATSDPYKTLFIARVSIDTSESKLKKEFEAYGTIRKVSLIIDKISTKPKGYAFVEYENEKDMHSAYKNGDGKKIDGRRILVDVERGRTVKGWLPRRLGGGLTDSKPRFNREEREEKNYGSRDRYERKDRDRNRRSRSKERSDRRRRSKSRERSSYKDRSGRSDRSGDRDRNRDRDRYKDRYERGYENDSSEQKVSSRVGYNDGDATSGNSGRRHRSRSRERNEKRRYRSRSRSHSQERKRSRGSYPTDNNGGGLEKERHASQQYPNYDEESGEIEEGEDRSYDNEYRRGYGVNNNNNGQFIKTEQDYDTYTDSSYNQPAYVDYNNSKDD